MVVHRHALNGATQFGDLFQGAFLNTRAAGRQIEQLARTYTEACAAFPDIEVFMDDLVLREDGIIEYRWTFTGTSAETGKSVRVPGFEEWTMDPTEGPARSRAARGWDAMAYSKRVSRASTLAQATATYLAE